MAADCFFSHVFNCCTETNVTGSKNDFLEGSFGVKKERVRGKTVLLMNIMTRKQFERTKSIIHQGPCIVSC
jgi:hypothetical protein